MHDHFATWWFFPLEALMTGSLPPPAFIIMQSNYLLCSLIGFALGLHGRISCIVTFLHLRRLATWTSFLHGPIGCMLTFLHWIKSVGSMDQFTTWPNWLHGVNWRCIGCIMTFLQLRINDLIPTTIGTGYVAQLIAWHNWLCGSIGCMASSAAWLSWLHGSIGCVTFLDF